MFPDGPSGGRASLLWALGSIGMLAGPAPAAGCSDWEATIVAVEGTVQLRPEGNAEWLDAQLGQTVCRGDVIRVRAYSRAAVRLRDETTVLRLDQGSSLVFTEPADQTGTWVDLLRGMIHVISRDPRALRFNTPYVNAGLEGTEFVIAVDREHTEVTVLEGVVVLDNAAGEVSVSSGQRAQVGPQQQPVTAPVADALAAARWTFHYSPVLSAPGPAADDAPDASQLDQAGFHVARAARRLAVGRVDEARGDLVRAAALEPGNAEADALQSIIALSEHQRDRALMLAEDAARRDPGSSAALIALSHAQQAHFDLAAALASAERATAVDNDNALARARVAELRLATGDIGGALAAAREATSLDPDLAHAHTVLGFVHLAARRSRHAVDVFGRAVELDHAAPLPRLGLGLALMRQRRIGEGRAQLELAVMLDPGNALARSYVAKTYHEEHRGPLSDAQIELAKTFDPLDPTPWLYDALRKHSGNRPIEALRDFRAATDRNDNRPPHRSRLRVDQDLGARSAGVGRLHRDIGFEQLALLNGWMSVTEDPAEYSGHRLLADLYSTLPRHQIARVDELYQSQVLQPINVTPIPPQLAEPNLFILDIAGPDELAFSEFTPLLSGNGLRFQGSAVSSGNATRGGNFVVAGLHDRIGYSVGHFRFATDGFRTNNDLDQSVSNAFVQFRPGHRTSVLAELRSTDTEKGDLRQSFDPAEFNAALRQREQVDSVRVGLRHSLGMRSELLGSIIHESADSVLENGQAFRGDLAVDGYSADLQHQLLGDGWQLIGGANYRSHTLDELTTLTLTLPAPPFAVESTEHLRRDASNASAYGYFHLSPGQRWTATIGASFDRVDRPLLSRRQLNPKLGVVWEAGPRTIVRAAAFRTLQAWLMSKHNVTPKLEPTQVAGFNQRYFGPEGERAWRYGVAVDHRLAADLYAGAELSKRDLSVPRALILPPAVEPVVDVTDVDEQLLRAYLYWTPGARIALSGEYQYENVDARGGITPDGVVGQSTHRLPLRTGYFHPNGLSASVTATYVRQDGRFATLPPGPDSVVFRGQDRFWVFDASIGYRLPRRRGLLSLNAHNLFDTSFRFQDTDPDNPRILPERMISVRFTVAH